MGRYFVSKAGYIINLERQRDARMVGELVERNQKEMTHISRHNAEKILEWFAEKWDCDWRKCVPVNGRLGRE